MSALYYLLGRNGTVTTITEAEMVAALERARVVGVLDGWAGVAPGMRHNTEDQRETAHGTGMRWCCQLTYIDGQCACYYGATPDEARAKAVAAIEAGEV